jgi:hypothetical protein
VNIYSTCTVCKQLLTVTDEFQPAVHPLCFDSHRPTVTESLAQRFIDALMAGEGALADRVEAQLASLHNAPPRLGEAALLYASWGWPVFPLQPGGKAPATRHGFKDATTDPDRIRRWWTDIPAANIGLPTGIAFDVIDVDPDGWGAWREMVATDALPDLHGMACTSRGGLHAYVKPTGGGNLAGVKTGIDYRGQGGYVVAAPSVRTGVGRWMWRTKPSPVLTEAVSKAAA